VMQAKVLTVRSSTVHQKTKLHACTVPSNIACPRLSCVGARIVRSGLVENVHTWVVKECSSVTVANKSRPV